MPNMFCFFCFTNDEVLHNMFFCDHALKLLKKYILIGFFLLIQVTYLLIIINFHII